MNANTPVQEARKASKALKKGASELRLLDSTQSNNYLMAAQHIDKLLDVIEAQRKLLESALSTLEASMRWHSGDKWRNGAKEKQDSWNQHSVALSSDVSAITNHLRQQEGENP